MLSLARRPQGSSMLTDHCSLLSGVFLGTQVNRLITNILHMISAVFRLEIAKSLVDSQKFRGSKSCIQVDSFFSNHRLSSAPSVPSLRPTLRRRLQSSKVQLLRTIFSAWVFAELTYRESLRDIETCLRAVQPKLYHAGIRSEYPKARSPMPTRNETGASTPTLHRSSSQWLVLCIQTRIWAST